MGKDKPIGEVYMPAWRAWGNKYVVCQGMDASPSGENFFTKDWKKIFDLWPRGCTSLRIV